MQGLKNMYEQCLWWDRRPACRRGAAGNTDPLCTQTAGQTPAHILVHALNLWDRLPLAKLTLMRNLLACLVCLLLSTAVLSGCSSTGESAGADPASAPPPPTTFAFAPQRYPEVHAACIQALRGQGFRIARNDYRFGSITTYPKESATLAEYWVDDATTTSQGASDSLNAHQRIARLRVEGFDITQPLEMAIDDNKPPPTYKLNVEVVIQRLQLPKRYLTNSASAQATASYADTPIHLRAKGITGPYAQRLARDPRLESRLLEAILLKLLPDEGQESVNAPSENR